MTLKNMTKVKPKLIIRNTGKKVSCHPINYYPF